MTEPRVLSTSIDLLVALTEFHARGEKLPKERRLEIEQVCCNLLATGFLSAHTVNEAGERVYDPTSVLALDACYLDSMTVGFTKGAWVAPAQKRLREGCESGGLDADGGWSCKCGARVADGPGWLKHAELPR